MTRWAVGVALLTLGVGGVVIVAGVDPRSSAGALYVALFGGIACAGHAVIVTGVKFPVRHLLVVAIALRILAFPMMPSLSDDAYRYVWDGLIQIDGSNPYLQTPAETPPEATPPEGRFEDLNSAQYYSVYPPASQLVFALGGQAARVFGWYTGYYVIKAAMTMAELIAIVLLLQLVSPFAAAIYALHPLAILEIAGQGHTEALAISALIACIWCARRKRAGLAGALWAVAIWTKLIPILIWPLLRKGKWHLALSTVTATVLLWWPYFSVEAIANISESVRLYAGTFDFFSVPFWWLEALFDREVAALVLRMPLIGGLFALALWLRREPDRWVEAGLVAVSLFTITSTTIHPWYLLLALCVLPFVAARPAGGLLIGGWLWFSATSIASYAFYGGHVEVYHWLAYMGWAGLTVCGGLALFVVGIPPLLNWRARQKAEWIATGLPDYQDGDTVRLADLGAGEGYVAEALAKRLVDGGASVSSLLIDTEDRNQTALPWRATNGHSIPMDDASADLVICCYVLHHTADADHVLSEIARVLKPHGRVAILESVFESEFEHRLLVRLDYLANRLRTLKSRPPVLLNHRTQEDWRLALERAGLSIYHEDDQGSPLHRRLLMAATKAT